MSSIEQGISKTAHFLTCEFKGQVASQYNPPWMQSLSKPYNVSKTYEAEVISKEYEIDIMHTVHEVDIRGSSIKDGPLGNVSIFKQAITLAPPRGTPFERLSHKYLPHKSLNTTAQVCNCPHWANTK